MKKIIQQILLPAALFMLAQGVSAQATVGDGIAPQGYSVLEMVGNYNTGTYGGMRLPQIENESQRPVIPAGEENNARGLMVFNMATSSIEFYDGERWVIKADPCAPPRGATVQSFCSGAKVSDLTTISRGSIQWYSVATDGTALGSDVLLTNNGIYYASLNGCAGAERLEVTVTLNIVPSPGGNGQSFCGLTASNFLDPMPGTANRIWYDPSGVEVKTSTALVSGTYQLVATSGACKSAPSNIAITINSIPAAPTGISSPQNLCATGATGAKLSPAPSTSYKWYNPSGTAIATTTSLTTSGTYQLAAVNNGCEGPRTPIEVSLSTTTVPTLKNFVASTSYLTGASLSGFTMNETGTLIWYSAATGTGLATALPGGNNKTTTFYMARVADGCESDRVAVTIKSGNGGATPN